MIAALFFVSLWYSLLALPNSPSANSFKRQAANVTANNATSTVSLAVTSYASFLPTSSPTTIATPSSETTTNPISTPTATNVTAASNATGTISSFTTPTVSNLTIVANATATVFSFTITSTFIASETIVSGKTITRANSIFISTQTSILPGNPTVTQADISSSSTITTSSTTPPEQPTIIPPSTGSTASPLIGTATPTTIAIAAQPSSTFSTIQPTQAATQSAAAIASTSLVTLVPTVQDFPSSLPSNPPSTPLVTLVPTVQNFPSSVPSNPPSTVSAAEGPAFTLPPTFIPSPSVVCHQGISSQQPTCPACNDSRLGFVLVTEYRENVRSLSLLKNVSRLQDVLFTDPSHTFESEVLHLMPNETQFHQEQAMEFFFNSWGLPFNNSTSQHSSTPSVLVIPNLALMAPYRIPLQLQAQLFPLGRYNESVVDQCVGVQEGGYYALLLADLPSSSLKRGDLIFYTIWALSVNKTSNSTASRFSQPITIIGRSSSAATTNSFNDTTLSYGLISAAFGNGSSMGLSTVLLPGKASVPPFNTRVGEFEYFNARQVFLFE